MLENNIQRAEKIVIYGVDIMYQIPPQQSDLCAMIYRIYDKFHSIPYQFVEDVNI